MVLVLPTNNNNKQTDIQFSSKREIPVHIKNKIESVIWYLKSDKDFVRFLNSHHIKYENISICIYNTNKEVEMIRKSADEAITVVFDSYISSLLQVSFTKDFLKQSTSKDFENVESLATIIDDFSKVNLDKLVSQYSQNDDLYLIDLSTVHNRIKEKGAIAIGRWIKSQIKGDIGVFIKDEFGNFKNHYDTTKIHLDSTFFDKHPLKPTFHNDAYYIPLHADERLLGICVIINSGVLEEIKIELFKLSLGTLSLLIKDL